MKKQLTLVVLLLTGGLAMPAAAQCRSHQPVQVEIIITGYRPCGEPIYAKRVFQGRYVRTVPLAPYELRHYLERRRRHAEQRAYERHLVRERFHRGRGHAHGHRSYRHPRWNRRCR